MSDRGKPRKPRSNPLSPSSPSKSLTLTLARMARRSLLKPTLFTALSLLALYSIFHASLSPPHRFPSVGVSEQNHLLSSPSTKIYLYDLPSKFTYGVIRSYLLARSSSSPAAASAAAKEDSELRYPGHQHSAEWWLFSDLIRRDRPPGSPIVRVDDPAVADLFYVPFFSSLSLVVNPIRPPGVGEGAGLSNSASYSDEGMQEELMNWLEGQEYWRRNGGRDHVFICQDPNALYKVVDRIRNSVLLVSDFGRLRPDQASLVKDVILPYSHRINMYNGEVGVEGRPSLLFFMGNRYRKEGGKVRDILFQVLGNEKNVIIKHGTQSRESRRMATQGMHSSKFCLHPAGDTPSACRLFDAIVSLCIPVIVSDFIELPFEDVIDYKKIAIFVETSSAVQPGFLTTMLQKVSTEKILQYQRELKSPPRDLPTVHVINEVPYVFKYIHDVRQYFEYEDRNGTVSEIWHQVSSKLPLIKLMINRDKRLVRRDPDDHACSCIYSRNNETTIAR